MTAADMPETQVVALRDVPPLTGTPSFLEAVRHKYNHKKEDVFDESLVGAEHTANKQQLDLLTRVFMHECNIHHAGGEGEARPPRAR